MLTEKDLKEMFYRDNGWLSEKKAAVDPDPRKVALKSGLNQLNVGQLYRILDYVYCGGKILLDEFNYKDGVYCPLVIGLGIEKVFKDPTNEKVFAVLVLMGYNVLNTRNVEGSFYRDNRLSDLLEAVKEVIKEKGSTNG
jgi:hypothetical protein